MLVNLFYKWNRFGKFASTALLRMLQIGTLSLQSFAMMSALRGALPPVDFVRFAQYEPLREYYLVKYIVLYYLRESYIICSQPRFS